MSEIPEEGVNSHGRKPVAIDARPLAGRKPENLLWIPLVSYGNSAICTFRYRASLGLPEWICNAITPLNTTASSFSV